MRADDLVGGEPAKLHRRRCRQRARIGGEEIAAGRQHVTPSARWRTGWAGRDATAVKRGDQGSPFGLGACPPSRIVVIEGGAAVNVQAVFDREVFQIAQPGVDAPQRFVRIDGSAEPGLAGQSGPLCGLHDKRCQPLAPSPVESVGLRIFIEQKLKLVRFAAWAAGNKRRRQMADRHCGDPALGLRRLAGIADDKRIKDRDRPGDDLRETVRCQRDRLAGQPFQGPMRAQMDHRIGLRDVLQP